MPKRTSAQCTTIADRCGVFGGRFRKLIRFVALDCYKQQSSPCGWNQHGFSTGHSFGKGPLNYATVSLSFGFVLRCFELFRNNCSRNQ